MKFSKSITAISIALLLSACGSDNDLQQKLKGTIPKNTDIVSPVVQPQLRELRLEVPEQDEIMVEDFPIAQYVTYPDDQQNIDSISSIDVNWPKINVHQAGKEYGYIDVDASELFYYASPLNSSIANAATDLERHDDLVWFVTGSSTLHRLNLTDNTSHHWLLIDSDEFTEVAIDESNPNYIWMYDQTQHALTYFNASTDVATKFMLLGEFTIAGLALADDQLIVLAHDHGDYMVMAYQAQGAEVEHIASWHLAGFEGKEFNDIALAPDGRVVLSTPDVENNIYLVADKSELIGDGPIEDTAILEVVQRYELDEAIAQPSGIWPNQDQSWTLITDQAEVFHLDRDFKLLERHEIDFNSVNCNQGCTEAIVGADNVFFALADGGLVGQFNRVGERYVLHQEFQIEVTDEQGALYSYSGLGHDATSGDFYVVPDQNGEEQADILIVLDGEFNVKAKYPITYSGDTQGSIYQFDAQGVHFNNGFVYVVSEQFTKVLKLNLEGEIVAVIDLDEEDVMEPSDIAIRDGHVYIVGDHENGDPVPPITAFKVEEE
ncbi:MULTISPECIES: hypothetical protein [Pseudoalteromonas]|uniref:Uncharacterized protein n=1 Tax=Pseudoalteromonas luteoviolacea (strain 2ta16) TaxID=1353533 RepID=V4JA79_PSEL2|nr:MULTISPECIES: hypothetical protein [Pseudoalteromonas]ESP92092.1 hypothetical protein PL2TA16_04928 [Pseudoalteromonas luteoviolacea 2ta16]KZN29196.1 hypothetical protein N483_07120 [Pseudoalteromonas luteoviolacea NCIMB 1944]MCG7546821.1 hypothetical protein [Pseudoalteromonas sp. Of7M-16]